MKDYFKEVRGFYESKGIGKKVGFGKKPAIIVVDAQNAFTKTECPIGADYSDEIKNINSMLDLARRTETYIIFTAAKYQKNLIDAGIWAKKINTQHYLIEGTKWVELDETLNRQEDEIIVYKKYASAFFGTSIQSILVFNRIDTLIITGFTTSGCIRATVIDGLSLGYKIIVPRQCVGDRHEIPHAANLFDIDAKYGDVIDVKDVMQYLNNQ